MKTIKAIAFSYPSSHNAERLGFPMTGCWHISVTYINIEGSEQCITFLPHDAEGYPSSDHPDLIAQFNEQDGEPSTSFLTYGPDAALEALRLVPTTNTIQ